MAKKSYEENGIKLSKKTLYSGDKIKISYNGLLAKAGAQNIILHYGFDENWDNSSFVPMNLDDGVFSTEILLIDSNSFSICFKDAVENWDNNSGENYVFTISKKPTKKESTETVKEKKTTTKVKSKK